MVGFIEEFTSDYWLKSINKWIVDLSSIDSDWYEDEILIEFENSDNCCYSTSTAKRTGNESVLLHHLFVYCS